MIFHATVVIGGVLVLAGVVLGNVSSSGIIATSANDRIDKREMFSTGEQIEEISGSEERANAITRYQEDQPHGSLYKNLKLGQVLVGLGVIVWIIGAFR